MRKNRKRRRKWKRKSRKKETRQLKEKQSCPKCGLVYGTTNDDILWIFCNNYDRWFDYKCSGLQSIRRIPKKYTFVDCV